MADPERSDDLTLDANLAPSHHDPEAHPQEASPDPTGRRKFVRTVIDLAVEIRIEDEAHQARTENLSPGGAFVCTTHLLEPGETLDLIITMPNQSLVTAHGVVRWVRPQDVAPQGSGMGIQFLQMEGGNVMNPFVGKKG